MSLQPQENQAPLLSQKGYTCSCYSSLHLLLPASATVVCRANNWDFFFKKKKKQKIF